MRRLTIPPVTMTPRQHAARGRRDGPGGRPLIRALGRAGTAVVGAVLDAVETTAVRVGTPAWRAEVGEAASRAASLIDRVLVSVHEPTDVLDAAALRRRLTDQAAAAGAAPPSAPRRVLTRGAGAPAGAPPSAEARAWRAAREAALGAVDTLPTDRWQPTAGGGWRLTPITDPVTVGAVWRVAAGLREIAAVAAQPV